MPVIECAGTIKTLIEHKRARQQIVLWTKRDLQAIAASFREYQRFLDALTTQSATSIVEKKRSEAAAAVEMAEAKVEQRRCALENQSAGRTQRGRKPRDQPTLEKRRDALKKAEKDLASKREAAGEIKITLYQIRRCLQDPINAAKVNDLIASSYNKELDAMAKHLEKVEDIALEDRCKPTSTAPLPEVVFTALTKVKASSISNGFLKCLTKEADGALNASSAARV